MFTQAYETIVQELTSSISIYGYQKSKVQLLIVQHI